MRGRSPWIAVAVGIAVVIIAGALIGDRDDSGETVPAGEWAQNVCAAVGVWRGQIEAIVEDIRTPSSVAPGGEEPQSETPQGRTGLIRVGVERALQATEDVVDAIESSGTPDTENGEETAETVTSWANGAVNNLNIAQDSLDEETETIDQATIQLASAVSVINGVLESGRQSLADIATSDPEVAAALQDSSTCQHVREETEGL
jgi:hypothetical protein